MEIVLHNAENQPIYEQIARQIKEQIIAGKLQPDDPLPSIRALAKDLRISVITTKRAYDELEQQGYLFTVAGKGSFVAPRSTEIIREEQDVYKRQDCRPARWKLCSKADICSRFWTTVLFPYSPASD